MTVVYFDSSAFIKLLVDEDGSDLAVALWDGCDAALSSRLAYPEVRAALAAMLRDRRIASNDFAHAESAWERIWAVVRPVELTATVTAKAGRLAGEHALRGADAIHLASALAISHPNLVLAAWDQRLRAGGQAAGLALVPPN
jgi:predicted nucleic acid-binding protein